MGRRIPAEKWLKYNNLRSMGMTSYQAATEVGISIGAANEYERGNKKSSGAKVRAMLDVSGDLPKVKDRSELSVHAAEALEDFEKFRYMFFGHVSLPWQLNAAAILQEKYESPKREYLLLNTPPEGGKTTLISHDFAAWLICRDRRVRLLLGSLFERLAQVNVERLRKTLTNKYLITHSDYDIEHGLAVNATHNLITEYGQFKPDDSATWTKGAFVVDTIQGQATTEKEPTVTAFGMDSGSLGWRVDAALWDDLADKSTMTTIQKAESQQSWYKKEAEKRVNINGLFALFGQRLGPRDIYGYAKSLRAGVEDDDSLDDSDESLYGFDPQTWQKVDVKSSAPPKYTYIRYRAHYDELCRGRETHVRTAKPYPDGCLLDPQRLNWPYLKTEMDNDMSTFMTVYQQEDSYEKDVLVSQLALDGGLDETGIYLPGNYNNSRSLLELPDYKPPFYSIITSDPSPANWWAVQWWLYYPKLNMRVLMDIHRKKMSASSMLDRDRDGNFDGLMERLYLQSIELRAPIRYWIYEKAAAQKFFIQMKAVKDWLRYRKVLLYPHETNKNKHDAELGVTVLTKRYENGNYDLPNSITPGTRKSVKYLTNELTTYPNGTSDDEVMANWFLEILIDRLDKRNSTGSETNARRPDWLVDPNAAPSDVHNIPRHEYKPERQRQRTTLVPKIVIGGHR